MHTYNLRKQNHPLPKSFRIQPWLSHVPYLPSTLPYSICYQVWHFYQNTPSQIHLLFIYAATSVVNSLPPEILTRVSYWVSPQVFASCNPSPLSSRSAFLKQTTPLLRHPPPTLKLSTEFHGIEQEIRTTHNSRWGPTRPGRHHLSNVISHWPSLFLHLLKTTHPLPSLTANSQCACL